MWNDRAFAGDDARGVLPAVLQQQQPVVEQLVDRRVRDDADDSAHESTPFGPRPRTPGDCGPLARNNRAARPRPRGSYGFSASAAAPAAGARAEFCHQSCCGSAVSPATSTNTTTTSDAARDAEHGAQEAVDEAQADRRTTLASGHAIERAGEQRRDEDQREGEHL